MTMPLHGRRIIKTDETEVTIDNVSQIIEMYKPLLIKESIINGHFDEDLFQEECITLLRCVEMFRL